MLEHIGDRCLSQASRSFNHFFMLRRLTLQLIRKRADESSLIPPGAATMLEIIERMERESVPAQDQASATSHRRALRSIRPKQSPAIALLIVLGLIPVAELVLFPERWHALPHGVQWAAYLASAIFFTAVCALLVNPDDVQTSGYKQDSAELRKRRKYRRLYQAPPDDGSARGA
jgi:hypothetical protein